MTRETYVKYVKELSTYGLISSPEESRAWWAECTWSSPSQEIPQQ